MLAVYFWKSLSIRNDTNDSFEVENYCLRTLRGRLRRRICWFDKLSNIRVILELGMGEREKEA